MSENIDPQLKAITTQTAGMPSGQVTDPQLESMMQSLMIQDPDLMRILKGEVHEYLINLDRMMIWVRQQTEQIMENYMKEDMQDSHTASAINNLHLEMTEIQKQLAILETQLKRYRRYVPYLLLFTSNSVLSNITRQEAEQICRKIDIMIMRDRLDCQDDETALEDINFFTAIGIRLKIHMLRNVEGFTFKGLIEEKRTVTNIVSDQTMRPKKRFGIL